MMGLVVLLCWALKAPAWLWVVVVFVTACEEWN